MSNVKRQIICEDVNTEEKMVYLLPFGTEFDFEGSVNKGNVIVKNMTEKETYEIVNYRSNPEIWNNYGYDEMNVIRYIESIVKILTADTDNISIINGKNKIVLCTDMLPGSLIGLMEEILMEMPADKRDIILFNIEYQFHLGVYVGTKIVGFNTLTLIGNI